VQFVITSTPPPLPITVVEVMVMVVVMMWKIFHVNTPPFVFAIPVVHSDAFALESYI